MHRGSGASRARTAAVVGLTVVVVLIASAAVIGVRFIGGSVPNDPPLPRRWTVDSELGPDHFRLRYRLERGEKPAGYELSPLTDHVTLTVFVRRTGSSRPTSEPHDALLDVVIRPPLNGRSLRDGALP